MAGYSPKSLLEKLGVAGPRKLSKGKPLSEGKAVSVPSRRALFVGAPAGYSRILGPLPSHVSATEAGLPQAASLSTIKKGASGALRPSFGFIQAFCRTESELAPAISALKKLLASDGMLWICWPKMIKGRKPVPGELNEARVRALGLAAGLVDVKVCAIDETWSGLKFVFRLEDRTKGR
ncbi:MAG: DUF3052 domain-containing protein [Fibrobacteres bacterium]|nr:DUF3052 domain-containing protein [Fibrobacterota bacterium]